MIKAFIFDLNGVLLDTEEVHYLAHKKVMQNYGIDLSMEEYALHGIGSKTYDFHIYLRNRYNTLFDVYQTELEKKNLFRAMIASDLKLMPFVVECLERLYGKYKLAVASTESLANIVNYLEKKKIKHYFDLIISGEEVMKNKPNPEIYKTAVEEYGFPADQCLAIEDSMIGVRSAKTAGLKCIAIPNSISKVSDFSEADMKIENLHKIDEDLISNL